jgi:hypothetical protein
MCKETKLGLINLEQSILVTCKQVKVGFDEFKTINPCNMQTSENGI